jgi:hypothetical protein
VIVAPASDCHVPISRGSPLRDLLKCTAIQINAITTRRTAAADAPMTIGFQLRRGTLRWRLGRTESSLRDLDVMLLLTSAGLTPGVKRPGLTPHHGLARISPPKSRVEVADRSLLPGAGEVDAARTRRLQVNDYLPELFIRTRRTPRLRFLSVNGTCHDLAGGA